MSFFCQTENSTTTRPSQERVVRSAISFITGDSVLRDPFQVHSYRVTTPKTDGTYDEGWFRYTASRQIGRAFV